MRVIEIVVFISCLPFTKRGTKPTAEKVDFLSAEKHRARALNVASRCIRNVMLILRRTACRTVAAFQESLASGAALTMIRPRHDGGGVTGHQGFTEATDRYTTSLSHGFLARFTSVRSTLPRLRLFFHRRRSLASVTVTVPHVRTCLQYVNVPLYTFVYFDKTAVHSRVDIRAVY